MNSEHPFSTEIPNSPPLNRQRIIAAIIVAIAAIIAAILAWRFFPFRESNELLHVSFDAARSSFQACDKAFAETILQSDKPPYGIETLTAGSIIQAVGISRGLIADVASFTSPMEIIQIQKANIRIHTDWSQRYPYGSSPFHSTIVWMVKPGADLESNQWQSLLEPSINPCMPDPDGSGAGRYAYFAIRSGFREGTLHSENSNTPNTDALLLKTHIQGDRASLTSHWFLNSPACNVLITWESDAIRLIKNHPKHHLRIVYPEHAIEAHPVVVELLSHTNERDTQHAANQYLEFLFSDAAQHCFADKGFRPNNPQIQKQYAHSFAKIELLDLQALFGSWEKMYRNAFGPKGHFTHIQKIKEARMGGEE